eukprot:TRINITY_DN1075_c0_g1_i1.p1 TRINITY_DN1075_c0_g1~~TRINITY_DN1075_c0_g1_i1.p1  ORF type:complete len:198 (+),score=43.45 TRINITY_DN1075_c0_g1_i1:215-808(+)
MPRLETLVHTFSHPWEDISLASWSKYPSPERPDVLTVDLIKRELDQKTGVLRTTRLMVCRGGTPRWLEAYLGSSQCFFIEEAEVDPRKRSMVLRGRNISFCNLLSLDEVCTYTPHPDEPDKWTHFKQEAKVTAFPYGISGKIENFCLQNFQKNAVKGREIMEQAIQRVQTEQRRWEGIAEEGLATIEKHLTSSPTLL